MIVTIFLLFTLGIISGAAETLQGTLRTSNIPVQQFSAPELAGKVTSYAISTDNPFLLAYYVDNGSGLLNPPLHVIRYDRATGDLRRADLRDINALFKGEIPLDCLGSAIAIREHRGTIYIDTHYNPSAGCVIVLSSELTFKAALSGWLIGLLGADYAILCGSEVHFMSVQPLHVAVFDLKRHISVEVYPYGNDPERSQFSRSIKPHISAKWCVKYDAQCNPENFNADVKGKVVVNEAAKVFGFEAHFDAAGFGDAAVKDVQPRTVSYIFRERGGAWEHREFQAQQLRSLGVISIQELVDKKPDLAFQPSPGK